MTELPAHAGKINLLACDFSPEAILKMQSGLETDSDKGRLRGVVRLSGEMQGIGSLREVLMQIRELRDQFGLLRITGTERRGYIGITNSDTISGAQISQTHEYGIDAFRILASVEAASYVVLGMTEAAAELQQFLKLPIDNLLTHQGSLLEAIDAFEQGHSDLLQANSIAQEAATTGSDLPKVESLLAWGGESPTQEHKITEGSGWAEDKSVKRAAMQQMKNTQEIPKIEHPAPVPIVVEANKPSAKFTGTSLKAARDPNEPIANHDKIAEEITRLRADQIANEKIEANDLELEEDKPTNALTAEERRRAELIAVGTWLLGLGLFFALTQQTFAALNATGKFQSGLKALQAGDNARAQVDFTTAIDNGAGNKAFLYRAVAESRLGHKEDAVKDFDKLIQSDPKNELARAGKAAILLAQKQYADCVVECDAILQNDLDNGDAYRLKALALCGLSDFKGAIDTASDCLKRKVSDKAKAEAYACRAFAEFKVKRLGDALNDYTAAIKLDPINSQLYSSRALVYKKEKQWASALADMQNAIKYDGANASLYKLRAECYKSSGNIAKAAADLDIAAKLRPSPESIKARANARLASKNFEGALEDFDYILTNNPNDKEAKVGYQSAKAALASAKPVALVDIAKEATDEPAPLVVKGTPDQLIEQGFAAMNARRSDEAVAYLSGALKARPRDVNARRYLAYTLVQENKNEDAAKQFAILASLAPLSAEDSIAYGKTLSQMRQYAQAARIYGAVVAQYPTHDQARQGLINVLINNNQRPQAIQQCQEGMARSPRLRATYESLMKTAQQPVLQAQ